MKNRAFLKVKHALDKNIDALITFCPGCMIMLESASSFMGIKLPTLNYFELLAIALGESPESIGLENHYASVKSILSKIGVRS